MDQSILIQAGASATTISILFVLAWIYKTVNHKRLRSHCCGHDLDASVDIEDTTPKEKETTNPATSHDASKA
jgi:hypothetical protein